METSVEKEIISGSIKEKTQQILLENGLDFRIEKLPMVAERTKNFTTIGNDGNIIHNTTKELVQSPYYGLYNSKSGNIINSVKDSYTVTQNDEIIEVMLQGAEPFQHILSVKKCININDGRKLLMQLEIEGKDHVNGDRITRFLNIVDSNDGTTCLAVGVGDTTLSCMNQFMKWYKGAQSKFQHSQSISRRIAEIPELIKNALSESDMLLKLYQKFESTQISRDLAHSLVNELLGVDKTSSVTDLSKLSTATTNIMNAMYANIEIEMNSKGSNLWGLHSGITRYTTHEKSAPKRDNGKIENIAFGSAMLMNNKSLEFAQKQLVLI